MEITEMLSIISNVGFPIAIAVWFMVVGHKDSQNQAQAINNLSNVVDNNTKALERCIDKIGV